MTSYVTMLLAILACVLLTAAPAVRASLTDATDCGELDEACCPPEDPDAPVTSLGPIYTCNSDKLYCSSTEISDTETERICLECGLEGNACCSGDTVQSEDTCDVEGNVCAIFDDEGGSMCTTCEDAVDALNASEGFPLEVACRDIWAAINAPAPAPAEEEDSGCNSACCPSDAPDCICGSCGIDRPGLGAVNCPSAGLQSCCLNADEPCNMLGGFN